MKKIDKQAFLKKVRIASPCSQNWDDMTGDDRKRLCELCNLNVYNIKEMSTDEAYDLLANATGRVCIQIYRRQDGTIITDDCPVALQRIRNFYRKCAVATIGLLVYTGIISPNSANAQLPWDKAAAELELKKRDLEAGHMNVVDRDSNPVPNRNQKKQTPKQRDLGFVNAEEVKEPAHTSNRLLAGGLSLTALACAFAFVFGIMKKRSSIWIVGGSFALAFIAIGLIWQWYW